MNRAKIFIVFTFLLPFAFRRKFIEPLSKSEYVEVLAA